LLPVEYVRRRESVRVTEHAGERASTASRLVWRSITQNGVATHGTDFQGRIDHLGVVREIQVLERVHLWER
jgi:hypothetical protein